MAQLAGLLVRRGEDLSFLPASAVRSLVPAPRLTKVPWDSAHMAMIGGDVVAVLELGEPTSVLVLCEVEGQAVALSGLTAERVGRWPESELGVNVDGVRVPALDLGAALKRFQYRHVTAKESEP